MSSLVNAQDELIGILLSRWQCNDPAGSSLLTDDIGGVSLFAFGSPLMSQPSAVKNDGDGASIVGSVGNYFGLSDASAYVFGSGGTLEALVAAEPNGNPYAAVTIPGQMEMVISGADVIFNLWTGSLNTLTASGALKGFPQIVECVYDQALGTQSIWVDGIQVISAAATGDVASSLSVTTDATISSSSLDITSITAGTNNMQQGCAVSGTDIPMNTFISSVLSSNSVEVNNQPTSNTTEMVTFGLAIQIAVPRSSGTTSAFVQDVALYSEPLSENRITRNFQAFRQILSDPNHVRSYPRLVAAIPVIARTPISINRPIFGGPLMTIRGKGGSSGGGGVSPPTPPLPPPPPPPPGPVLPYGHATNGMGSAWTLKFEDKFQVFNSSIWGGGFPASPTPYNSGFYTYDLSRSVSCAPPPPRLDNNVQIPAPPEGGPNVLILKTFLDPSTNTWYSAQLATYDQIFQVGNIIEWLIYASGAPTNSGTPGSHFPDYGWTTFWWSRGDGTGEGDVRENDPVAGGQIISTYHVGDGTGYGGVIDTVGAYSNRWTYNSAQMNDTSTTFFYDGVAKFSTAHGPASSPTSTGSPTYDAYLFMTTGITTAIADLVPYTHCVAHMRIFAPT